ncbi:MAG: hypothetical protein KFF49_06170, partial [Bacteroidales bacterium]|nr:hypothetical protein [Bacteroidales bacterium]
PREKVSMKLRIDPSYFTNPDLCNISISVAVDEGSISGKNIVDLSEYMQEYPTVEGIQGKPAFYHENTGVYLEGSLIARETLQAVEGRTLYLSIPGKSIYLRYSDTGADGNFSFLIPPYRGSRDFIIQPADFRDDLIIKTGSPFAGMHEYDAGGKVVFNEELLDYASRLGVNYQVNKIYDISHSAADTLDYSHSEGYRFYGKPDIQVHLDDYIELPTMQEVFHELVPGVALRRQGGRTGFVFVTEPGAPTVKGPDAILLDGVMIDDPSFIAGLDPELIERIDVIRGEYQAGKLLFNGIVSIVSQEGDMCGIDYPNAGLRTSGTIMDKEQRFINMIYSDSLEYDPSIPDFRNTLYWDPTVKPDDEGIIEFTFYTSDFLSEYSIIIQGLTDKNKAVSYHDQIDVTGN